MERYGNIRFNRRVVAFVCMLVVAMSVLMNSHIVYAQSNTQNSLLSIKTDTSSSGFRDNTLILSHNHDSSAPVYSFILESTNSIFPNDKYSHQVYCGYVSKNDFIGCDIDSSNFFGVSGSSVSQSDGVYFYNYGLLTFDEGNKFSGSSSDIFMLYDSDYHDCFASIANYVLTGEKSDGMIIGGSDTKPTAVTNQSIGYLQDVKLNLSYITPIKGDSILETTNYQIYTDMIYNLKWNSKKTSTNYDLSSSYVQLYAKAEYRKSEFDDVTATDFIELGDYEKASKGKLKFSYMELFKKSNNCKSAYLSAFPLSSVDYKDGNLSACSVTSNIKYKFYIRVYKGTDKGPWLCVSEKGSHHSNEFVNSGDKVPFNVSSGDLDSDGTYKPDGNINENGNGITGTGKDKDDADADTNANDKIQTKHDSSDNSVWDNLENLVSGIASVPIIIKDIFSFLPSWCFNVTATGFALLITLCIIKFVRGK